MVRVIGIDEAGRGPVIGPMVMVAYSIDEEDQGKLTEIGVKDSKLLSEKKREKLFDEVIALAADYKIKIVEPSEIDAAVLSDTMNLNWLEAHSSAELVNQLEGEKVYVDCPSTNPRAYQVYFEKLLTITTHVICEHKADANYPCAAAASIIAKVIRDREIKRIQEEVGQPIGSGYPSDPHTRTFLEKNWNKFDCFRKSWSSWQKLAEKKNQSSLGDF